MNKFIQRAITIIALLIISAFLLSAWRNVYSTPAYTTVSPELPRVIVLFECYQPVYYIVQIPGSPYIVLPSTVLLENRSVAKIVGMAMVQIENAGQAPEIRYMDSELGRVCS